MKNYGRSLLLPAHEREHPQQPGGATGMSRCGAHDLEGFPKLCCHAQKAHVLAVEPNQDLHLTSIHPSTDPALQPTHPGSSLP